LISLVGVQEEEVWETMYLGKKGVGGANNRQMTLSGPHVLVGGGKNRPLGIITGIWRCRRTKTTERISYRRFNNITKQNNKWNLAEWTRTGWRTFSFRLNSYITNYRAILLKYPRE
jgi:hypothetical protein